MVAKSTKRLGVGATASTTSKDAITEADWTKFGKKKILSVGKNRIDEDDVVGGTNDDQESSSDEEEGRTSAVKERKRKVQNVHKEAADGAAVDVPSSKKKKKGKKERAAAAATSVDTSNANNSTDKIDATEKEVVAKETDATDEGERKKTKRKKSRSKQKNIRKDNRSETDRPSYLNHGSSGYAGRPLTNATKEKLGLNKEKDDVKFSLKKDNVVQSDVNNNEEGTDTGTLEHSASKREESNELSKIGDCVVGEIVQKTTDAESTKRKKPRKKFKNC